jgi:hypothetical protein
MKNEVLKLVVAGGVSTHAATALPWCQGSLPTLQGRHGLVDFDEQLFEEHQSPDAISCLLQIRLIVKQHGDFLIPFQQVTLQPMMQVLEFMVFTGGARFGYGLAPLHLFDQEVDRHQGVALTATSCAARCSRYFARDSGFFSV